MNLTLTRRHVLVGSMTLATAGCATTPMSPTGPVRPITLVGAFTGRHVGKGRFQIPIVGVDRGLTAVLYGRHSGNTLSVSEHFLFDDGEKQHLTWHFTRTGPRSWSGRREDVVGEAKVEDLGTEIRLSYEANVVSKGSKTLLQFSDVLYRQENGVIINNAVVKKAGFPIGTTHLVFQP